MLTSRTCPDCTKLISVVIPAMNEAGSLRMVLEELSRAREILTGYEVEAIVVNDHSTDETGDVARGEEARLVDNKRRRGKGAALITGFEEANGDYIVMMDADGSHRALDIPRLIEPLERGAGLVIGSRIYGGSDEYTRLRALGNVILTLAFGIFHHRYLSDALNGFKAFRREVFDRFTYTSRDFEIEIELLADTLRLGMDIIEVPSHERARDSGVAKSRIIRHGTKFLARILREWAYNKIRGIDYSAIRKT